MYLTFDLSITLSSKKENDYFKDIKNISHIINGYDVWDFCKEGGGAGFLDDAVYTDPKTKKVKAVLTWDIEKETDNEITLEEILKEGRKYKFEDLLDIEKFKEKLLEKERWEIESHSLDLISIGKQV